LKEYEEKLVDVSLLKKFGPTQKKSANKVLNPSMFVKRKYKIIHKYLIQKNNEISNKSFAQEHTEHSKKKNIAMNQER
jgi:hypothetical protein